MIFSPPFGVSFDVDIVGISVSVDVTTGFGVFAIKKGHFFENSPQKQENSGTHKKQFSVYD